MIRSLLILAAALPALAQQHWVATWGTAQQQYRAGGRGAPAAAAPAAPAPAPPPAAANPGAPARRFPVPRALAGVHNQTVRMTVRTSIGGKTLRVRLSNALGAGTVQLGAAHLAIHDKGSAILPASDRTLTFSGKGTAAIQAGQVLVSDPVNLDVPPLTDLVSLWLPNETGPPTSHTFALKPTYISGEGDFTGKREIPEPMTAMESWYWLAGIDVLAPADAFAIVTFGDSITDGDQSSLDGNHAWPSLLARRLQGDRATAHLAVVNAGISGNRVLGDNNSALARMVRDVVAVPGVRWITLLEGINDITGATRPGAAAQPGFGVETLTAAYRQIIDTAHLYGVKIAGCTMTPYAGSSAYSPEGEAIRVAANQWIRTSGSFDAVIDFEAATRDASTPPRFRAEADSPDLLHPGDVGYQIMADSIRLGLFRR